MYFNRVWCTYYESLSQCDMYIEIHIIQYIHIHMYSISQYYCNVVQYVNYVFSHNAQTFVILYRCQYC